MIYTGAICTLTWIVSYLMWLFNVDGQTATNLPAEYEAAKILILYFFVNAVIDLFAYWLVSKLRIRWHTEWLCRILLISSLVHVAAGVGYATGMEYEHLYMAAMWVIAIAQLVSFGGPGLHRRFSFHFRLRRHLLDGNGAGRTAVRWPNSD